MMLAAQAHAAGPQMMAAPVAQASPQESAGLAAKLAKRPSSAGLGLQHGFAIGGQHPGVAGTKITRAQHTYNGLRVFGSESVIVTDAADTIVSESVSDRRAGLNAPRGVAANGSRTGAPELTPSLSSADAIAAVVKNVAPNGVHRWAPQAELLIYPVMKTVRVAAAMNKAESALNAIDLEEVVDRYELAYLVKTRMADSRKRVLYHDTVVNAKTGAVIAQWEALQTVVGTGNSQYNGAVPINTTLSGSTYQMKDPSRGVGGTFGGMAITNANHAPESNPTPGNVYTNSSNTWGDGQQQLARNAGDELVVAAPRVVQLDGADRYAQVVGERCADDDRVACRGTPGAEGGAPLVVLDDDGDDVRVLLRFEVDGSLRVAQAAHRQAQVQPRFQVLAQHVDGETQAGVFQFAERPVKLADIEENCQADGER
eukprot:gene22449-28574_t